MIKGDKIFIVAETRKKEKSDIKTLLKEIVEERIEASLKIQENKNA